jgi:DNA-binding LacI/PurR family transcriptional regulator
MEAAGTPTQSGREPTHVLVVSNETVGGHKVLEAIEQRAARGPIRCTVVCPQNKPRQGFVIYDDTVRSAARVRLEAMLDALRERGIPAHGEVMDPDPYIATQDAIREWGADEVIVSTYPYPRSGMMRRDLIDRIRNWSGLPVEHVIVDLREEPVRHVLVVASQTVGGPQLIQSLERRATSSPHRFTVIAPQSGGEDGATATQERLDQTLRELRQAGLDVTGYVTHPDPLTSIRNAFQTHPADEIVISTLPQHKSRWLRGGDLISQARRTTGRPVEHLVFDPDAEREPAPAGAS